MIIELAEPFVRSLLNQPESGMGWQAVGVQFRDATSAHMIALNAGFLISDRGELRALIETKGKLSDEILRTAAREQRVPEVLSLRVLARPRLSVREGKREPGSTEEAPEKLTGPNEDYRRFSAFENDLRITPDWGLRPGTYGTTGADADTVKTGMDAVRRYALPNPSPAKYEFVIRPPAKTVTKEGIVKPAHGQPGGGVEVIFVQGSPANTVNRGRTLPEY